MDESSWVLFRYEYYNYVCKDNGRGFDQIMKDLETKISKSIDISKLKEILKLPELDQITFVVDSDSFALRKLVNSGKEINFIYYEIL